MSEVSYTESLLCDTIKAVNSFTKVAWVSEAKVLVNIGTLQCILFNLEEILAHYRKQHYIIQIEDMHGMNADLVLPEAIPPELVMIDLNLLWDCKCPICGEEYEPEVDTLTENSKCKLCGFEMRWAWSKDNDKIAYWVQHHITRIGNLVDTP